MCEWIKSITGQRWSTRRTQIGDYIFDQVEITGHTTFPKSVLSAVQFLEECGAVAPETSLAS
eukprot:3070559-Karenia_brevis.AAC.1